MIALVLALLALAPQDEALPAAEAFERDLALVEQRLCVREWERARTELDGLLLRHQGASYVRARRAEIESMSTEARFWLQREPLELGELLSARVASYDFASDEIELRYSPRQLADFTQDGKLLLHPLTFGGDYEVRFRGQVAHLTGLQVLVGMEGGEALHLLVGGEFEDGVFVRTLGHKLRHFVKGEGTPLGERDPRRMDAAKVVEVALHVSRTSVRVTYGGRALFREKKRKDAYGQFGFFDLNEGRFSELTIRGRAAQGWAREHIAGAVRAEYDAYRRGAGRAKKHLPEWLFERATLSDRFAGRGEAKERLRELGALMDRGRWSEAEVGYRTLLAEHPDLADVYADLIWLLLLSNRPAEARTLLVAAEALCPPSRELEHSASWVRKVSEGPDFERSFEWETERYRVVSNLDRTTCVLAARELEHALAKYAEFFSESAPPDRFTVYVFSNRETFLDYIEDLRVSIPTGNLQGLYMPVLKQLLVCNQAALEDTRDVLRHEGFHQFLDQHFRYRVFPPLWFNEGLAEYFRISFVTKRDYVAGALDARHVAGLGAPEGLEPLGTFLALSPRAFLSQGVLAYARSWAFVHFLLHSGPQNEARFRALVSLLRAGESNERALEVVFAKELADVDRAFARHVGEMGR
jgi:hypothetical protein